MWYSDSYFTATTTAATAEAATAAAAVQPPRKRRQVSLEIDVGYSTNIKTVEKFEKEYLKNQVHFVTCCLNFVSPFSYSLFESAFHGNLLQRQFSLIIILILRKLFSSLCSDAPRSSRSKRRPGTHGKRRFEHCWFRQKCEVKVLTQQICEIEDKI